MTKKYNADAVVICMMRFCDPEEFDYPIYKPEFEAAGVRYTVLDLDIESPSLEQLRTRIQAFSEISKNRLIHQPSGRDSERCLLQDKLPAPADSMAACSPRCAGCGLFMTL